jgi:hypothetical protein
MSLRNIFTRSEEVPVPEIDVEGDRLRVPRPEPEVREQEGAAGGPQNTRDLKLPKTTWF